VTAQSRTAAAAIVTTTVEQESQARDLARVLVEERLAACVHVFPGITSTYRWQGATHETAEWALHCKTAAGLTDRLVTRLRALHPYEVPEILVLPVSGGDPAYLAWIAEHTSVAESG